MEVNGCNVTHQLHLHGKVRGCNCNQRIYQIKWGFKLKIVGRQRWNICEGVNEARVLVSDNDDKIKGHTNYIKLCFVLCNCDDFYTLL